MAVTINGTTGIDTPSLTADTTTLVVDETNNRVGIGTLTPNKSVEIFDSANTQLRVRNGANDTQSYDLGRNGSDGLFQIYGNQTGFTGYSFGGVDGERMRIDSAGRVTMPHQPYFAAEMNGSGAYVTWTAQSSFPFNYAQHNVGGHFNTSNYRFTAPVTGKYLFTASFIGDSSSPVGRIMFYVNGGPDNGGIKWGISGSDSSGGGDTNTSAIVYLNANDYVDVRSQSGSPRIYRSDHSSFTGMLLG